MKTEAARCAQLVKKDLKNKWPLVKFSVKSDNFSMGNAVRVQYFDAIPSEEVESLLSKYEYGHFSSMEDMYINSNTIEGLPQVKYLQVSRKRSEEVTAQLLEEVRNTYQDCENKTLESYIESHRAYMSELIYRLFVKRSFI